MFCYKSLVAFLLMTAVVFVSSASPSLAEDCSAILQNGIFNEIGYDVQNTDWNYRRIWMCGQQFSTEQSSKSNKAVVVFNSLGLGYKYDKDNFKQFKIAILQ